MIWNALVISQGSSQLNYVSSILEVISLMQALVKADSLSKNSNGRAAYLVPLMKMRTIILVTFFPSVVLNYLLYTLVLQCMYTGWASILWTKKGWNAISFCGNTLSTFHCISHQFCPNDYHKLHTEWGKFCLILNYNWIHYQ